MNHTVLQEVEQPYLKQDVPEFRPGDTVRVHVRVVEGGKKRIQIFEGVVIARKHRGIADTITVRKGKVRRAKLY